jgi:hypothetical protein
MKPTPHFQKKRVFCLTQPLPYIPHTKKQTSSQRWYTKRSNYTKKEGRRRWRQLRHVHILNSQTCVSLSSVDTCFSCHGVTSSLQYCFSFCCFLFSHAHHAAAGVVAVRRRSSIGAHLEHLPLLLLLLYVAKFLCRAVVGIASALLR